MVVVIGADLGRDGEAGGNRQPKVGHLGKVGPLAAQQVLHPRLALGLPVTEGIDPLRHRSTLFGLTSCGSAGDGLKHAEPKRNLNGQGSFV
jgi:hypothetical protein